MCVCVCDLIIIYSFLCQCQHTHTHTQRERERGGLLYIIHCVYVSKEHNLFSINTNITKRLIDLMFSWIIVCIMTYIRSGSYPCWSFCLSGNCYDYIKEESIYLSFYCFRSVCHKQHSYCCQCNCC